MTSQSCNKISSSHADVISSKTSSPLESGDAPKTKQLINFLLNLVHLLRVDHARHEYDVTLVDGSGPHEGVGVVAVATVRLDASDLQRLVGQFGFNVGEVVLGGKEAELAVGGVAEQKTNSVKK